MTILSLYLSKHFRTGGQKRYLALLTGLAQRGHKVVLFFNDGASLPLPISIIGIPLFVRSSPLGEDYSFASALFHYLRTNPITGDIILQFGESSTRSLGVLKKLTGLPVLLALRNNWVQGNQILRNFGLEKSTLGSRIFRHFRDRWIEHKVNKVANHLVFQSEFDRADFLSRQSRNSTSTSIIPNSTQVPWFDPNFRGKNLSTRLENLLFVGSEDPRKGLLVLLQAFARVRRHFPYLTLTLIGHFKPNLLQRLTDQRLNEGILVGSVVESTFPFLASTDLFVIPSLYDSFPNTLLEALYTGTPSIGSDVAGIKVMLQNPDLLFPVANVDVLEKVLRRLLEEPEAYLAAATFCRTRAADFDFDWIEPWEAMVQELTS
jgi:glycosyltransferase involved in cell wall biosynthesis